MAYKVTLIPGDGTGPEIARATVRVLEATGVEFEWEEQIAGEAALNQYGTPLPEHVLESIRRNKVAIKGPIGTPVGKGFRSVNVGLRKELDLYCNLRPAKYYEGVRSRYSGVDLIVFRENMEDLYAGLELEKGTEAMERFRQAAKEIGGWDLRPDAAVTLKVISEFNTRRIVKRAFEYARAHGRRLVTAVHKANICKFTDGLFLEVARQVAQEYPDVEFNDRIVDNMCMQLVQKPELYDVLVMPNLYGDILSDLCAGLVGGLGVAPSANLGDDYAVFEPVHGSAPKYAGQNKVNPMAMMFSGVLMLRHLGENEAANRLEQALAEVIRKGEKVTYDMKPDPNDPTAVGTSQVADAVIEEMEALVRA
ncbi:MAG TPA: isocitrate/isopropylmalate dehydrogenase family protein [Candidatus Nitrosotenuis sp.]|nr:isocitrate/isopropylmalate dehydrogenase family protein [Candidatus Nitrosotenuis sp.]